VPPDQDEVGDVVRGDESHDAPRVIHDRQRGEAGGPQLVQRVVERGARPIDCTGVAMTWLTVVVGPCSDNPRMR
jgi:hypothetical protein